MALEMKVYSEIRAYEAKVIGSLSWRQLACVVIAVPLLALATWALWERAQWAITYVDFVIFLPLAVWGWWRPKGLKPEVYLPYIYDRHFSRKVLTYDVHQPAAPEGSSKQQARAGEKRRRGSTDQRLADALEAGTSSETLGRTAR
ncbi:PrgI family protein [Arsenicicoccus bolidensis]|uniref:PrgI family protein n=1 Tax=Arsenicicoccus bolidensis TaxID=229480 RepID=UPI0028AA6875|nr:PrgI family protein [Arsenicicoccus bolidensis]